MSSRRGRPSSAAHPTVAVTHLDTGKAIAWTDGLFAGDPDLVRSAEQLAAVALEVRVGARGQLVTTGSDSPLAAAATMLDVCGGRGIIAVPADPEEIPGWEPDEGCVTEDLDLPASGDEEI